MKREANHVTDIRLGGKRVRLTVIDSNEPTFAVEVVGKTWKRSECPTQRPCPRAFCAAHLYRIDGSERAGRPGLAKVARDSTGLTVSVHGALGTEREGTLDPRWLSDPLPPSCGWDVIERAAGEPMDNVEVGEAIGKHRTLAARIVERALAKLKSAGVSAEDIRTLMEPESRAGNLATMIKTGIAK